MAKYLTAKQAKTRAEDFKESGVNIDSLKVYTKLELKRILTALGEPIEEMDCKEDLRNKIYVMCFKK